jgi:hypothetical protein
MPATVATLKPLVASQPDMVADVASLAGVGRIDRHQFNTVFQALVAQKHPQLEECPTVRTSPLRLVSGLLVGTFSNACQVLNRNNCVVLKCRQDNKFADVVVQPSLITPLTSRQPLQNLSRSSASRPCALRCFCLERCSYLSEFVSHVLNRLTVPFVALAGYCNITPPKVNTDYLFRLNRFWCFVFELNVDIDTSESIWKGAR